MIQVYIFLKYIIYKINCLKILKFYVNKQLKYINN